MIRPSTIQLLKDMRLSGIAAELERQLADVESYRELTFEDRLAMLVDSEWSRRQSNKYKRCIHNARFPRRMPPLRESNTMRTVS